MFFYFDFVKENATLFDLNKCNFYTKNNKGDLYEKSLL